MNIAYQPYESKENKYIEISQKSLKNLNCNIYDFDNIKFGKWKEIDVVILNWYESVGAKGGILFAFLRFIKKIVTLLYIKSRGVKIVFTFHNKFPHDAKYKSFIYALLKFICKISDKIIILSSESQVYLSEYLKEEEIKKKIKLVPHPNYIGVYENENNEKYEALHKEDAFNILFMGQIRHYKNVELILEVAKKFVDMPINFIIAGKPENDDYKKELENMVTNQGNVQFLFGFIKDSEIYALINTSDILLLPYDLKSSMNSGTVILAFSHGKTVICPEISTLQDFDKNLYYGYQYSTQEEHLQKMEDCIQQAYLCWKNNIDDFESKGKKLYKLVQENNSLEKIQQCYDELMKELNHKK